jgi:hypothetical protein
MTQKFNHSNHHLWPRIWVNYCLATVVNISLSPLVVSKLVYLRFDTSQHLKELNINLQEANKFASEIRDKRIISQMKLRILKLQNYQTILNFKKRIDSNKHFEKFILNNKLKFVFKKSVHTRPQSNVFNCHLPLILELFQLKFKYI